MKTNNLYSYTLLTMTAVLILSGLSVADPVIAEGAGDFVFDYELAGQLKKIPVYYFAPKTLMRGSRIVFILHGAARSGKSYRDAWQKYALNYNFLIVCPEFSEAEFPGWWKYNGGNIYDMDAKKYTRREDWTFNVIEGLFDYVRQDRALEVETYCIFGHSAGAQFVHRMVLFMPDARFSLAIANGPGSFTEPTFDKNFTDGLKNTPATEETLVKAFGKEMILLMGDKDLVSKTMPRTPEAFHEYDRVWKARLFFDTAKKEASKRQIPLNWILRYVPGADHNDPKHAEFGSRLAARSKKTLASSDTAGEN